MVAAAAQSAGHRGVNGPEVRAVRSLKFLDRSVCNMVLAYDPAARLWPDVEANGGVAVPFRFSGKFDFRAIADIRRLMREHRTDVIHTQGPASLDFVTSIAARSSSVPHVITRPVMIDDLRVPTIRRHLYKSVDSISLRNASAVVAVSNDAYSRLEVQLGSNRRLHRVYNGVELCRYLQMSARPAERFGIDSTNMVVAGIGQLTANKGWEDFLKVVQILQPRYPTLQVLLVGDGPMRTSLESLCNSMNLGSHVRFTGHIHDTESVLRCADLFLLMSHREGLSVAVLEAMAAAVPCVCTDVGGVREQVLDGETGYLVGRGQIERAAQLVGRLLDDRKARIEMGARARTLCAAQFNIKTMVRHYEKVYHQVIQQARDLSSDVRH
jgi:glycosyltransferase involved in cell wall biosynthesis